MSVRPVHTLPRFGRFPEFSLPDTSGRLWSNSDLRGRIWIASSFPRGCSPCAVLILKMTDLQTSLEKAREVLLVSFVSDPPPGPPKPLPDLARELGARPGRWVFLSGGANLVSPGTALLVDDEGQTRAEFDSTGPDFSSEVLDAVGDLLRSAGGRRQPR
jgi:cytochrome oxidase Cu insertion factor (SCO1/SenC/PrrC family)